VLVCCGAPDALAYRPFDGTDAAVADPGEFEAELGVGGIRRDAENALIAPAAVLNLGLIKNWEAVFQSQGETVVSPHRGRARLLGNGVFAKGVLQPGVMQGSAGPSVATEIGALLPGMHGDDGAGASWAWIVSQRWGPLTTHLNGEMALTRDHHADYFVSGIFEGPFEWAVRPVGELFWERDMGAGATTLSGLVGAIWQARDDLAFDVGLREAHRAEQPVTEVRFGLTFAVSVW
jgi:hypothetical protein